MGTRTRGLLQAEWWPKDGWGLATPRSIAASFPIGCTLYSAGKDCSLCIVCQNTWRKAAAGKAPYIAYFITCCKNLEGDMVGQAHRSTQENQSPAVTSSSQGKAWFGGNHRNTVIMKHFIKDCSLFSFLKNKNM